MPPWPYHCRWGSWRRRTRHWWRPTAATWTRAWRRCWPPSSTPRPWTAGGVGGAAAAGRGHAGTVEGAAGLGLEGGGLVGAGPRQGCTLRTISADHLHRARRLTREIVALVDREAELLNRCGARCWVAPLGAAGCWPPPPLLHVLWHQHRALHPCATVQGPGSRQPGRPAPAPGQPFSGLRSGRRGKCLPHLDQKCCVAGGRRAGGVKGSSGADRVNGVTVSRWSLVMLALLFVCNSGGAQLKEMQGEIAGRGELSTPLLFSLSLGPPHTLAAT